MGRRLRIGNSPSIGGRAAAGDTSNGLIVLESQTDEVMASGASTNAGAAFPPESVTTREDAEDTVLIIDSDESALAASPPVRRDSSNGRLSNGAAVVHDAPQGACPRTTMTGDGWRTIVRLRSRSRSPSAGGASD